MTEVIIVDNAERAGAIAGEAIARLIGRKPEAVLGLATGSTPLPVYRDLAVRLAGMDVSRVSGFALDEYVGIPREHPESYHSVIAREVVEPLGLNPSRVHVPNGQADDLELAAAEYEAAIVEAGGVDLQILGIGTDGHIGFNEPGSSFASRTRIKTLTQQTLYDNARFFDSSAQVPRHALTQGLGTILDARHLVLLAFGSSKAAAVAAALEGPLSAMIPATAIHLHARSTVILDEAAAAELKNQEFYRYTWEHKPEWQRL
jgi:glucosamine-6-phosphate deaminase